MQRLLAVFLFAALALGLAACSKGGAGGDNGGASGSSQLSWDQGNWNQTSWQ